MMKNTLVVMVGMTHKLGVTISMAKTMTMAMVMLMKKMMTMTMAMAAAPACESLAGWHQVFHLRLWGCTLKERQMLNAKKKGVTSLLSLSLPPQLPVSQGDLSPSRHWVDQHDHDHFENLFG